MGTSIITFGYPGNKALSRLKIRENIRDLRAIRGKRQKKESTTDNTEIHGMKKETLNLVFKK